MEYIRVTKENLESEHICCAISNNKDAQVASKKAWLADRWYDATEQTNKWKFGVRNLKSGAFANYPNKSVTSCNIYYWDGSKYVEKLCGRSVRPIITLRADVTPKSGRGIEYDQYKL